MISLYGDPDELDRLAGVLRARADGVRQAAVDQATRAGAAEWVSVAATAYRERLARARTDADRTAHGLEEAAAALAAHAQVVRERIAAIARIEQEVADWLSRRVDAAADAVGSAVRRLLDGDLPGWGGPLPSLPLPPSGDLRWLEVDRLLSRDEVG